MNDAKDKPGEDAATVVVTVSEEALGDMEAVKKELEDAGMAVEQVLDFVGQIVGKWSPTDMEPLRRVAGVADVEASRAIQLPPPGSQIQ